MKDNLEKVIDSEKRKVKLVSKHVLELYSVFTKYIMQIREAIVLK